MKCENEKEDCLIESVPDINAHLFSDAGNNEDISFYYFGDPMCSWCWGGSDTFSALEKLCEKNGIGFSVVTGGGGRMGAGTYRVSQK